MFGGSAIPQDGGFVALTNRSEDQIPVAVKVFAPGEQSEFNTSVLLLPRQTQQVDLKRAFEGLPSGAKSGGVRIQYQGAQGSILATGGLENVAVGYSAKIPFGYVPSADSKPVSWTMASVGMLYFLRRVAQHLFPASAGRAYCVRHTRPAIDDA